MLLTLLLLSTGLGGCGDSEALPANALMSVEVTGGIVGYSDHLVVYESGRVDGGASSQGFRLTKPQLSELRSALKETDFESLESDYSAGDVVDEIHYRIVVPDATVDADYTAAPAELRRLLSTINEIQASSTAGSQE